MLGNAHSVSPSRLVTTIFDLFFKAGGTFREAEVVGMTLEAARYVLCLGNPSCSFAAQMRATLPMAAEPGYHGSFSGESGRLRTKVMNGSTGFRATQMENGLQHAATVELASPDAEPEWRRTDTMMRKAAAMFAGPLPKEYADGGGGARCGPTARPSSTARRARRTWC